MNVKKHLVFLLGIGLIITTTSQIIDFNIDDSEEVREERVIDESEEKPDRSKKILYPGSFKLDPRVSNDNCQLGSSFDLSPSLRQSSPFGGIPIYLANQSLIVYS